MTRRETIRKDRTAPVMPALLPAAVKVLPALLLAACSGDERGEAAAGAALRLGAEVSRAATRATVYGTIDNTVLAAEGFGVFACEAGGGDVLFDNRQVTKLTYDGLDDVHVHGTNWSYGQELEWPEGKSYDFFAYAPYVEPGTQHPNDITPAWTGSSPTVGYTVAADPRQSVDLLWGVNGDTGLPWKGQTGASNGGLVLFNLHHATAALGFHVQVMVDKDNDLQDLTDASSRLGTDCKVTIGSITIKPVAGSFYGGGTLYLDNSATEATPEAIAAARNKPRWDKEGAITSLTVSGNALDEAVRDQGDLAPSAMPNAGVTETAGTQAAISGDGLFMLIPDEARDYEVSVEYYVTYATAGGGYHRLSYTGDAAGKATIAGLPLESDTRYYVNLVLGLRTFSLSVSAGAWSGEAVPLSVTVEEGTSASASLAREE